MIEAGTRFYRFVTTGKYETRRNASGKTYRFYECICDCGTKKYIRGTRLQAGEVKSCGCLIHDTDKHKKHGRTNTRLYRIWNDMRTRCNKQYNDHYDCYGGRGISVCKDWDNTNDGFQNFEKWALLNGYKNYLTIDRVNVNGNYEPSNCKWVTRKDQAINKRDITLYQYKGMMLTRTDISRHLGVDSRTFLHYCTKHGVENAISFYEEKEN